MSWSVSFNAKRNTPKRRIGSKPQSETIQSKSPELDNVEEIVRAVNVLYEHRDKLIADCQGNVLQELNKVVRFLKITASGYTIGHDRALAIIDGKFGHRTTYDHFTLGSMISSQSLPLPRYPDCAHTCTNKIPRRDISNNCPFTIGNIETNGTIRIIASSMSAGNQRRIILFTRRGAFPSKDNLNYLLVQNFNEVDIVYRTSDGYEYHDSNGFTSIENLLKDDGGQNVYWIVALLIILVLLIALGIFFFCRQKK